MGSTLPGRHSSRARGASRAGCGTPSEMLKDGAGVGCLRPAGAHPAAETSPGVLWVREGHRAAGERGAETGRRSLTAITLSQCKENDGCWRLASQRGAPKTGSDTDAPCGVWPGLACVSTRVCVCKHMHVETHTDSSAKGTAGS